MNKIRKSAMAVLLAGAMAATGVLGIDLFRGTQYAMAQEQVNVTRQELATLDDLATVYKKVAKVVGPSVVEIEVTKTSQRPAMQNPFGDEIPAPLERFFRDFGGSGFEMPQQFAPEGGEFRQSGTGSGVIMEASGGTGYILTNNHVAGDADTMKITMADGRVVTDGKLLGADPRTDLAVIEIKADRLIPAQWGDSGTLEQGDQVLAFGCPFGYVGSMTHGMVSALHRQAGILGSDGYENFIQVDAPINPGNSGGPLVNLRGEVVGINTAIASSTGGFQGIGFAIPSGLARPIYNELKSNGQVVRGWLGLEIQDVARAQDEARSLGYEKTTGVLVRRVAKNSPAEGKLMPGDIVTTLDGEPTANASALRNPIALKAPGTEVSLGVIRNGEQQTVRVTLGEMPANLSVASSSRMDNSPPTATDLGMSLADLGGDRTSRYGVRGDTGGAGVVSVRPNSPAAQAGISVGDVITSINGDDVTSAKQATDALAKADLKKGIRLQVENRDGSALKFLHSDAG